MKGLFGMHLSQEMIFVLSFILESKMDAFREIIMKK